MGQQNISPRASIGKNNVFGHGVTIGDNVVIGDDNIFEDNVIIRGNTTIGSGNYFDVFVAIGGIPTTTTAKLELKRPLQYDAGYKGQINIGDRNVFREFINVDMPTAVLTSIGNDCYIAQHCAIAHDVIIEDGVILTNDCSPGGHTRILAGANLGKGVQTHQRVVIGQHAMLGVGAVIIRSILPGVTAAGNPARFLGVNKVGLERHGFEAEEIDQITRILTCEEGTVAPDDGMTLKVRSVLCHFTENLANARDPRTLPAVTLPASVVAMA